MARGQASYAAFGAVAAGALACGGPRTPAAPRPLEEVPLTRPADAPPAPAVNAQGALPTLADLAASGPRVAPGFTLFAQGEVSDGRSIELAKAEDDDICVRGVFAADAPVRATLALAGGEALAVTGGVEQGVLGRGGPVCARRGSTLTLQFYGAASHMRYVVWVARPTR